MNSCDRTILETSSLETPPHSRDEPYRQPQHDGNIFKLITILSRIVRKEDTRLSKRELRGAWSEIDIDHSELWLSSVPTWTKNDPVLRQILKRPPDSHSMLENSRQDQIESSCRSTSSLSSFTSYGAETPVSSMPNLADSQFVLDEAELIGTAQPCLYGLSNESDNMIASRRSQGKHARGKKTLKEDPQPYLSALHHTRRIQHFKHPTSKRKPQHRKLVKKSQAISRAVPGAASDEPASQSENADLSLNCNKSSTVARPEAKRAQKLALNRLTRAKDYTLCRELPRERI